MAADPAALTRFLELVACTAGLRTGTLSWFIPAVWAAPAVVETTDWAETDADRLFFLQVSQQPWQTSAGSWHVLQQEHSSGGCAHLVQHWQLLMDC